MKYLIFDSSSIINLVENGLTEVLIDLKKQFQGEFIITPSVKYETVEHPLKIQRFEWGALRVRGLIEQGILKLSYNLIDESELKKETQKMLSQSNSTFFSDGRGIHLIDLGEAESLAANIILKRNDIESVVVIDERTERMICENPESLKKIIESKIHKTIRLEYKNLDYFRNIKVIRSTELAYLAYKKDLIDIKSPITLEAILYALKYGGCSISEKEIKSMINLK